MKKLILSILFLFITILCSAQITKFKATFLNMRFLNDTTQTLGRWEGWEECDVKLEVDLDKLSIAIYSEMIQHYEILELLNKDDREFIRKSEFKALDTNGYRCTIVMVLIKPSMQTYLHIAWTNLEIAYELEKQ